MIETKRCYACTETKPVTDFYKSNVTYYQKECKACNKLRKGAWHRTEAGKRSSANTKLKARFGITIDDYETMYSNQGGKCLCCGATASGLGHRLAIDHCHNTGVIRGLLCKNCNVALGHLKEDKQIAKNLIKYIESYCEPIKNNAG